jgi:MFS family permease
MAIFAMFARSPDSARVLIVLVGLTQGGCYAAALLLAAQLSPPAQRGQALGQMLAAGSFGYLVSVLASYAATAAYGPQAGFGICAAGALLGAIVSQAALPAPSGCGTPALRDSAGIPWREMFSPVAICLLIGYVAHCWELLGYWAWTPALLTTALSPYRLDAVSSGFIIAAVIHLSGMLATAFIGRLSDRWPRSIVLIVIGGAGAMSSALLGWSAALAGPWPLVCAAVGSFFILGDSGVLSAAMTDEVAPGNLGKVMGLRSLLGFGAGALAPAVFGVTLDTTRHWGWAYLTLAAGGASACIAAIYLYLMKR